ncbi:transposase [Streptomyces sp. CMB-StM0423]|uniref:transposase n=1 Tax=Streptomyces sp. CMB-StM0423 TaxID=2059884 RepID=UPI003FA3699F
MGTARRESGPRPILCSVTESGDSTKAVVVSLMHQGVLRNAIADVSCFRTELYACLTTRRGALLCTDGPGRTLVDLALAPEQRRGHGALYGGLNQGRIDVARLRRALASVPLPRATDGRMLGTSSMAPTTAAQGKPHRSRSPVGIGGPTVSVSETNGPFAHWDGKPSAAAPADDGLRHAV